MNTIPLVKGNTQEEINTSLIALKKALDEINSSSSKTDASVQSQIKQINELITNINSHLDTVNSEIEDLQPVDTVTSGNMHSVTSNAVANFAFDKSRIRTGVCTGGSANNDDWIVTFDEPFQDNNYIAVIVPCSHSGVGYCPSGWYVIGKAPTGFSIFCNGSAPINGFEYIAINYS